MSYQRGSIRQEARADGKVWVYRWYRDLPNGKRAETTRVVGPAAVIGHTKASAWRAVERLKLVQIANEPQDVSAPTFGELAASYMRTEITRLAHTTAATFKNNLLRYFLPQWQNRIAVEIKPLEIEAWFGDLLKRGLAPPTIAKLRAGMVQVYRHAQRQGLISRAPEANPLNFARASAKSDYKPVFFTPEQAADIIAQLERPERTLALLSAVTGLRISESSALVWSDLDFAVQRIFVRRTWVQGKVGKPKTDASAAPVPMSAVLARELLEWRAESAYAGQSDWVFASWKSRGRRPREGGVMAADYIRPAAIKAGVITADYKGRVGFHSFRHGVANFLVSAGTDPKTVQGLLRHAKVQTTLDLYCQTVSAQAMKAQEQFIAAMQGETS